MDISPGRLNFIEECFREQFGFALEHLMKGESPEVVEQLQAMLDDWHEGRGPLAAKSHEAVHAILDIIKSEVAKVKDPADQIHSYGLAY